MVSLPGWTFSDSCPFCHLFILFVFWLFIFVFALVCFLNFALLLVVIAVVVLCLLSPVCFFSYFLLVAVRPVRCCSLLLLLFLFHLLWTFRLCLVPAACWHPLFSAFLFSVRIQALLGTCCLLSFLGVCSFFCSLTFAITSFDLEGNGLCCNGLCRNGKAVAEERRFAGFLCGMNINGKKE